MCVPRECACACMLAPGMCTRGCARCWRACVARRLTDRPTRPSPHSGAMTRRGGGERGGAEEARLRCAPRRSRRRPAVSAAGRSLATALCLSVLQARPAIQAHGRAPARKHAHAHANARARRAPRTRPHTSRPRARTHARRGTKGYTRTLPGCIVCLLACSPACLARTCPLLPCFAHEGGGACRWVRDVAVLRPRTNVRRHRPGRGTCSGHASKHLYTHGV